MEHTPTIEEVLKQNRDLKVALSHHLDMHKELLLEQEKNWQLEERVKSLEKSLSGFVYCQAEIEERECCKLQCDHCASYYAPLENVKLREETEHLRQENKTLTKRIKELEKIINQEAD